MEGTPVSYGTNSLKTDNIIVSDINHEDAPVDLAAVYKLAHKPKNTTPYSDDFEPKVITLIGRLKADSIPEMDTLADTFRGYFTGTGKNLDIGYAGSTRRYVIAKCNRVKITRPNGLTWATFEVDLITASYGQDIESTEIFSASARTASSYTDSVEFSGNAPHQMPIITITLTDITDGTEKTVNFSNDSNGQQVSITRDWADGDVIVIDTMNDSVTVNDVEFLFDGALPNFPPGPGVIGMSDDFSARDFNIDIIAYGLYL